MTFSHPALDRWIAAALLVCLGVLCMPTSADSIRTFADGLSPRRDLFVSPAGSDRSGDGSRTNPYRTIARATQGVEPGDAIRLLPGTYPGGHYLDKLAGREGHPVWLGGVPGQERPVLKGGSQALHLVRARYLVVENLEIADTTQNGINCDDGGEFGNPEAARHLVFRHLHFHDIGRGGNQDALKLSGVNDYFVLDCTFARTSAGGSGIDQVGCHDGCIAHCTFTDMGSNAIQCKGGSENIQIQWNRFHQGGQRSVNIGGSTDFQFFRPPLSTNQPNAEARNIRVIANLFRGSDAPIAFVGAVQSLVANNTIVAPQRWVIRILQETTSTETYPFRPCGQNHFVNNIAYFRRTEIGAPVNVGPNTDPASFGFSHNLWYAFDQPNRSQPKLPTPDTNSLVGLDPQFVRMTDGEYALRPESPAVGKGIAWPGVRTDLVERDFGQPPSIGASEVLSLNPAGRAETRPLGP